MCSQVKEEARNNVQSHYRKSETPGEISVLIDEANIINGRIRERALELFERSDGARGNNLKTVAKRRTF